MKFYSVAEVKAMLGCKEDKILALIASKELIAINIATNKNASRPTWRIHEDDLQAFVDSRKTVKPSSAATTPRRRQPKSEVIKFF